MNFSINEAKKWSIKRLQFELDTLRDERRSLENELRHLEMEYDMNPGNWGGSYPVGLDNFPKGIESVKKTIRIIEDIIRSKL